MIRISAGTAHILGFCHINTDVLPTTAYLMTGERCIYNCGFCPQSRTASSRPNLLSRITWLDADLEDVAKNITTAFDAGRIKRVCLQAVSGSQTLTSIKHIISTIKRSSNVPFCVSARLKNSNELKSLADSNADRITVALDAASPKVFGEVKNGSWEKTLEMLTNAVKLQPGRISTHLIVGLGETEEEMVRIIQQMRDMGITTGLFAFTPVPGTRMALFSPPKLDSYRRIQVARYLIEEGLILASQCKFNSGLLTSFGLNRVVLKKCLVNGKAFQTSGCPDCNRPYYNERPGGVLYNYPSELTPGEIEAAIYTVLFSLEEEG